MLQHYAALGRDIVGAESVNLTPVDAPKDVYSDVLALVWDIFVLCALCFIAANCFDVQDTYSKEVQITVKP